MTTTPDPSAAFGFGTPWKDQIDYLRNKLNLPTKRWDDITRSAHDRAFIVAGAQKADLVNDLHDAMNKAAAGGGLKRFQKDFSAIVAKHGWTGWKGEGSKAGEAWRTKLIYTTNMATSYAAGRYQQLTHPDSLAAMPYWRYIHADGILNPRPQHMAWHGLTLLHDHPFWTTHFPPNGFNCHCRVTAVGRAEGLRSAKAGLGEPPAGWDQIDTATGEQIGIGKSWGYAPGASVTRPLQEFIDAKLINLPAPIGAAMWETLKPALAMERQRQWWETLDAWTADPLPRGRTTLVGTLDTKTVQWLADNSKSAPLSAEIGIRDNLLIGPKQARHEAAQNGLTLDDWRYLTKLLDAPSAIYFDTRSGKLIYVSDGLGPVKVALEFDPVKLKKSDINLVESAFLASDADIAGAVKGGVWKIVQVSGTPGGSRTHISGK